MSERKALILGASGFLGSALLRHLSGSGYDIASLGRRQPQRGSGSHFATPSYETGAIAEALKRFEPDVVFQLAGATSGDAEALRRANIGIAQRLLSEASRLNRVPTIVLIGSAAEYGATEAAGQTDEAIACRPQTDYGRTKHHQTGLGLKWAREGFPVVIARPFNVIGPGMPEHLALGRFARKLAELGPQGGTLRTGPLHAVRDFLEVSDVAAALEALSRTPAALGEVVNICSGHGTTMRALLNELIDVSGARITVAVDPERHGVSAVPRMVGCPDKLQRLGAPVPRAPTRAHLRTILDVARMQVAANPEPVRME